MRVTIHEKWAILKTQWPILELVLGKEGLWGVDGKGVASKINGQVHAYQAEPQRDWCAAIDHAFVVLTNFPSQLVSGDVYRFDPKEYMKSRTIKWDKLAPDPVIVADSVTAELAGS